MVNWDKQAQLDSLLGMIADLQAFAEAMKADPEFGGDPDPYPHYYTRGAASEDPMTYRLAHPTAEVEFHDGSGGWMESAEFFSEKAVALEMDRTTFVMEV